MKDFHLRQALFAAGLAIFSLAAHGQDDADAGVALDLDQVRQLAIERQPMLDSLAASARSARESAVAARQLPDPQIFGGVRDLPIDGDDAGSFTRDSDTQVIAGLSQEFPGAGKRRLRGMQGEREAERLDASRSLAARSIARDAALAWLDVWQAEQEAVRVRESLRDAEAQVDAVGIAVKAGKAPQAELFAARVEAAMLRDRIIEKAQDSDRARNALSRWIGVAAQRPLCPDLPAYPALPSLDAVLAR
ncbi:MAG: TolC family protein, partial [Solimonas sp.]